MKTINSSISEVKIIYSTKVKASDRPHVKCSKDAFELFMESWNQDAIEHTEEFKCYQKTNMLDFRKAGMHQKWKIRMHDFYKVILFRFGS